MYPENLKGTQVIVGSMNMGNISRTTRNRTHNMFRPKREPIPLCHSDGHWCGLFIWCSHHANTHQLTHNTCGVIPFTACVPGYFGTNCTWQCFCRHGVHCSFDSGTCPNVCEYGYTGISCNDTGINLHIWRISVVIMNQKPLTTMYYTATY